MEENSNNEEEHLDKYTKERVEKNINDLLQEKELKIKWRKEINESSSIQAFFSGYLRSSVESFINHYLSIKYHAFKLEDYFNRKAEERRDQWINKAHEHLEIILQKKLFDLQCLWRAEQITLEGVEICYDFEEWSENIINCPFIETLTKEDIALYQSFLNQNDDYYGFDNYIAQEYEQLKEEYTSTDDDQECIMPAWYEFHNSRTGNGSLLLLPDTRGEKENFYMGLWQRKNAEEHKAAVEAAPPAPIDTRPHLSSYDGKDLLFFVETFEDRETQQKIRNYNEDKNSDNDQDIEYDELIYKMLEVDEYIPIEAHYDYREALKKAYVKFKNKKIAEHLPLAHEQYLFNKKMGFVVDRKGKSYSIRDTYYNGILSGRELNGEPRDFNF